MCNAAVLLCAGHGRRFGSPKQLYILDGKPLFLHSLEVLRSTVDIVLVVTNSLCYERIRALAPSGVHVLQIESKSRSQSIKAGLEYFQSTSIPTPTKVIIHDAARPFINRTMITDVLEMRSPYTQYAMELQNGLAQHVDRHLEIRNRDDYVELCTPIMCGYELLCEIYGVGQAMKDGEDTEIEPITALNARTIPYTVHYEPYRNLRKITTLEDL